MVLDAVLGIKNKAARRQNQRLRHINYGKKRENQSVALF